MNFRQGLFIILIALVPFFARAETERQALEAYDLESLSFLTIYQQEGMGMYAIVRDPMGYVHRVFKGDRIGRNFGRVVDMSNAGLRLREVVQAADGEWVEREAWLRKHP